MTQFALVPLLLQYWGTELFADWIAISALTAYLGLSDVGMASAGGNLIAIHIAREDYRAANRVFQSVLVSLLGAAVIVLAICAMLALFADLPSLLNLCTVSRSTAANIVVILGVQAVVGLFDTLTFAIYRAAHQFPRALMAHNLMRCAELAAWCVLVPLGGKLYLLATMTTLIRLVAVVIMYCDGLHKASNISFGLGAASSSEIHSLIRPSLAFMCLPIGNAIRLQGMTLLGRRFLGTNDFLAFSTARTLANSIYSASTVINSSVWPELTRTLARNELAHSRRLHRGAIVLTGSLAVLLVGALVICGPTLLRLWTGGRVLYQAPVYLIQLAAAFVYSLWQASSVVSVAFNAFGVIALGYVCSTALALIAGYGLVRGYGAVGLAASAFVVDVIMIGVVVPRSLRLTGDSVPLILHTIRRCLRCIVIQKGWPLTTKKNVGHKPWPKFISPKE